MRTDEGYMEMLRSHPEITARMLWLFERDGRGQMEFYRATGVNNAPLIAAAKRGSGVTWRTILKVMEAFPDREDRLFLLLGEGDVSGRRPVWKPWSKMASSSVWDNGGNAGLVVASPKWRTVETVIVYRDAGGGGFPDGSPLGVEVRMGDRQERMTLTEFEESRRPQWWCFDHDYFLVLPGPWVESPDREK